jgi:hypothetical protein
MPALPDAAHSPPARMINLTMQREIKAYPWVYPDEER